MYGCGQSNMNDMYEPPPPPNPTPPPPTAVHTYHFIYSVFFVLLGNMLFELLLREPQPPAKRAGQRLGLFWRMVLTAIK